MPAGDPPRPRTAAHAHMAAGSGAGLISTALLHPIDLVKTRFQVERFKGRYATVPQAFRAIAVEEGARALYQGLSPALLGSGASWGLYFFFYERAKQRRLRAGAPEGTRAHLTSACEAGVCTVFLTNPIWLVKTRMQLQEQSARAYTPYRGFLDALTRIVREEGPLALYRGLTPALLLVSHGAIQFMVYERLKREFADRDSSVAYLAMGAASKTVAATATYPHQVVKARLQQRPELASGGYRGYPSCARDIWVNDGQLRGLYRGFVPNLMRVVPGAAITFFAYEGLLGMFSD